MSYSEYKKITIHEFRLIKTQDKIGIGSYILMTKYSGNYKPLNEKTELMWSHSLIQEMDAGKDYVPFGETFIRSLAELKHILRGAAMSAQMKGISFIYIHQIPGKPEEEISGRFITTLAEGIYEKSMTAEAYAVMGENLYVDYVYKETIMQRKPVIESEKRHIWKRLGGDCEIFRLYFDRLRLVSFDTLYSFRLNKVKRIDAEKGYVIQLKKWYGFAYVSGIRTSKGPDRDILLLHPDIDMAIGFANEDEALETILAIGDKLKLENFEVCLKPSEFFSIYESPPSVNLS